MQKSFNLSISIMKIKLIPALSALLIAGCTSQQLSEPLEEIPVANASVTVRAVNPSSVVTDADAITVAERFSKVGHESRSTVATVRDVLTIKNDDGTPSMYVVRYADNQGYVIVSAYKDYMPVMAHSATGTFELDSDNQGLKMWIENQKYISANRASLPDSVRAQFRMEWEQYDYLEQNIDALASSRGTAEVNALLSSQINEWRREGCTVYSVNQFSQTAEFHNLPAEVQEKFLTLPNGYGNTNYGDVLDFSFAVKRSGDVGPRVQPMIQTRWLQAFGFNDAVPSVGTSSHPKLGCTTIAAGQIMKYHEYPNTFDWSLMLPTSATDASRQFLYELACRIGVEFGINESPGTNAGVVSALKSYGYANAQDKRHDKNNVIDNLLRGWPVYMSGQYDKEEHGHAWICDGYYAEAYISRWELWTLEYCSPYKDPEKLLHLYDYTIDARSYAPMFHVVWGFTSPKEGYYSDMNFTIYSGDGSSYNYSKYEAWDIINIYPVK